ncbi:GGDEF domain-containing protein, partial [Phocaeicola vulgatus]
MADYTHSFQLFVCLLDQLIQAHPDPDEIWNELKGMDSTLAQIEQETFDGVYMVYQDRYLYSWDTPYAENESTGYQPQSRPWYQNAVKGQGAAVFTPPYMSYANHYILSTISQLQPDQETVFAYDIKMGNIQQLVHQLRQFDQEQLMISDNNGTIIGSDQEAYLGSVLSGETAAAEKALRQAEEARDKITEQGQAKQKAQEEAEAAALFLQFLQTNSPAVKQLLDQPAQVLPVKIDHRRYYGTMQTGESYHVLLLVPLTSLL